MDETGMSDADKVDLVEDVLTIWGEEAAREFAERYHVDLDALKRERSVDRLETKAPIRSSH